MPRKVGTCQDCGAPCYGSRCRLHANAYGVRNYPTVITQMQMPASSWWTEPDFWAAYRRELPRLLAVRVAGSPVQVLE